MRLKIYDSHLTCKVANKCLNVCERVEVVEWNKKWSSPFPCCPVSRQCPWKKTLIEKKKENDGRLSLLEKRKRKRERKKENFVTNPYQKKTFIGAYPNFNSFIPETYKTGLIKSLLFRCFSFCSDFVKLHHEIDILKSILYKISYPHDFAEKCIKEFLEFNAKNYRKNSA